MYCLRHVTTQVSQKICVSISHSPFNLQVGGVNAQNISQFLIKFRAMLARTNIMPFSIFYPETPCICSTHPQIRWELNSSLKPSCHLPASISPPGISMQFGRFELNNLKRKSLAWNLVTNKDLFTHQIDLDVPFLAIWHHLATVPKSTALSATSIECFKKRVPSLLGQWRHRSWSC